MMYTIFNIASIILVLILIGCLLLLAYCQDEWRKLQAAKWDFELEVKRFRDQRARKFGDYLEEL